MERHRRMDVFLENVERERVAMHLTQKQMAQKLDMSLSGYKKMIAGETAKVDLQLAYRMYDLTGKYLCELFGDTTPEISMVRKIKKLSHGQSGGWNDLGFRGSAEGQCVCVSSEVWRGYSLRHSDFQ